MHSDLRLRELRFCSLRRNSVRFVSSTRLSSVWLVFARLPSFFCSVILLSSWAAFFFLFPFFSVLVDEAFPSSVGFARFTFYRITDSSFFFFHINDSTFSFIVSLIHLVFHITDSTFSFIVLLIHLFFFFKHSSTSLSVWCWNCFGRTRLSVTRLLEHFVSGWLTRQYRGGTHQLVNCQLAGPSLPLSFPLSSWFLPLPAAYICQIGEICKTPQHRQCKNVKLDRPPMVRFCIIGLDFLLLWRLAE